MAKGGKGINDGLLNPHVSKEKLSLRLTRLHYRLCSASMTLAASMVSGTDTSLSKRSLEGYMRQKRQTTEFQVW